MINVCIFLLLYNYDNKINYNLVIDINIKKIKEKFITYALLYMSTLCLQKTT